MDPGVLTAIVVTLGTIFVGYITVRQTRQGSRATTELATRVVDREDFKEIMDRNDAERDRTEKRIDKLEKDLEAEVALRKNADDRSAEAENRAAAAERRATTAERVVLNLEKRVTQLEKLLEDNHIPVPPIPPD